MLSSMMQQIIYDARPNPRSTLSVEFAVVLRPAKLTPLLEIGIPCGDISSEAKQIEAWKVHRSVAVTNMYAQLSCMDYDGEFEG
jgi:hypothetical protein